MGGTYRVPLPHAPARLPSTTRRARARPQVAFTNSTNLVVSVPVPCSGTSRTGWRFSSSQCRINEVYGWAEYAEEYAAKVRCPYLDLRGEGERVPSHVLRQQRWLVTQLTFYPGTLCFALRFLVHAEPGR